MGFANRPFQDLFGAVSGNEEPTGESGSALWFREGEDGGSEGLIDEDGL